MPAHVEWPEDGGVKGQFSTRASVPEGTTFVEVQKAGTLE